MSVLFGTPEVNQVTYSMFYWLTFRSAEKSIILMDFSSVSEIVVFI